MDIQTRREIRMRKILGNSESRLKKITSYALDEELHEEIELSNKNLDTELVPEPEAFEEPVDLSDTATTISYTDTTESLGTLINNLEPARKESTFAFEITESGIYSRNTFIILLPVLVRCLLLVNELFINTTNANLNKIFMPLFLFEILEYVFFRPNVPQYGALNMLLMLNSRIKADYVLKICSTLRLMSRIGQDLMVYFFFFVCFDKVVEMFY